MRPIHLVYIVITTLLLSCKKDEADPVAPIIKFVSITTTQVESFNNEVKVVFSYEDYQGDLGNEDPDILSVRVKDSRLASPDLYHIPPMTPNSQELRIKGEYELALETLFLIGNGNSETATFTIEVRDRAGNWSNSIQTPTVTITP